MGALLQTILNVIRSLFGSVSTNDEAENLCSLPDIEIFAPYDLQSIPSITTAEAALKLRLETFAEDSLSDTLAGRCTVQVKPQLGVVNIRLGPRLEHNLLAQTTGGIKFELAGASEPDPDGKRWFGVQFGPQVGWMQGDMLRISPNCLSRTYITEADLETDDTPSPTECFPLPADVQVTQGYHSRHRGLDLETESHTPIRAAAAGMVIRLVHCSACEDRSRPNIFPCPDWVFRDEDWGFGYGTFLIIRHSYNRLPLPLREEMDTHRLTGGFAYVLYAHLSQIDVNLGDILSANIVLGLTGNSGCSSAPHLHFEVKIGRDETIDGNWQHQRPVNPNKMFII